MNYKQNTIIAPLGLIAVTGTTYLLYSTSLGAPCSFDDIPNLQTLSKIRDSQSALTFILSGEAGPLGRPLALTSFALQFSAWPHATDELLRTNIVIHLVNGLLLMWFAIRLAEARLDLREYKAQFAFTLFSLWTLQPLLASASLMIVQRMTTLSATFSMLGLIGYLAGRERIVAGRRAGWLIMLGSLSVATLTAILTKEIGALLPIYVWVLEYTLLSPPENHPTFRIWKRLLYLPLFILLGYVLLNIPYINQMTQRGFTSWQRLLAEGPILWTYARLILVPRASEIGPFHDDAHVASTLLELGEVLVAWTAWLGVIVAAVLVRRRHSWFTFATTWFLLGHALESSIFNLELYFEHRNYLPAIGPLAWISSIPWQLRKSLRRVALGSITIYLLLLGFVLHEVTTAWGNPDVAARLWGYKHQNSERAQQFLANRFLAEGNIKEALSVIEHGFLNNTRNTGLAIQAVQLTCEMREDPSTKLYSIFPYLERSYINYSVPDTIERLIEYNQINRCPGLTNEKLHRLIDTLLSNPNYLTSTNSTFKLHHLKARLYFDSRELDPTIQQLELAFDAQPDLDTAVLLVGILKDAGLNKEALKKIANFKKSLPINPVIRRSWMIRLSAIEDDLSS